MTSTDILILLLLIIAILWGTTYNVKSHDNTQSQIEQFDESVSQEHQEQILQETNQEESKESEKTYQEFSEKDKRICNASIHASKLNAYGKMFDNSENINNFTYPICDNKLYTDILYDTRSSDNVVDDYRNLQQYVKSYLEDPIMRGYNVNDYDDSATLLNIGKINITNGEKQPKAVGFVFDTSPAYKS